MKLAFPLALAPALALGLALALAACSSQKTAPAPVTCERPIEGLDLAKGRVVWFGEMHGTAESPKFVGDVVCQASRTQRVQLGLEIWTDEQSRIDKFLEDGDRETLITGAWWKQRGDGRNSVAMAELIERVRELRKAGAKISIVAYDVNTNPRDKGMADFVRDARKHDEVFVGLSNYPHAWRARRDEHTPMAAELMADGVAVKTYDVSVEEGTLWACMGENDEPVVCGPHKLRADPLPQGTPWTIGPPRDEWADGVYYVGKTTASPPPRP